MRPPLTRSLFSTPAAHDLLKTYALAQSAGDAVVREMRDDSTLAFEQALRNLRDDGHAHHLLMSMALPLYLQALLLGYSETLHADALRYSALVDELLKLKTRVYFISLNYDTLLDYRLGALSPLRSMSSYIDTGMNWCLIKPHGSVNWYYETEASFDPRAPGPVASQKASEIQCVPADSFDLRVVRGTVSRSDAHLETRRYPAIALPEGPKDELVLPEDHLFRLKGALQAAQEIDLLVLGYSGLDTEVLELVRSNCQRIRRMTVVNRDPAETLKVYSALSDAGIHANWPDTFDGSYEQWVDGDGLRQWVREFGGLPGGPYPSLTEPSDLENRIAVRDIKTRQPSGRENWLTKEF